jgi:hypothetical protein
MHLPFNGVWNNGARRGHQVNVEPFREVKYSLVDGESGPGKAVRKHDANARRCVIHLNFLRAFTALLSRPALLLGLEASGWSHLQSPASGGKARRFYKAYVEFGVVFWQ